MGAIQRPARELDTGKNAFITEERADLDAPEVWPQVDALLEKIGRLSQTNKHLRELVTQLSVLVIRNVVEREA
jgi:hypothetical protein